MATLAHGSFALDQTTFDFGAADRALTASLRSASLLSEAEVARTTDPLELFSAARSDYARILSALYAEGYYGGTISIRLDGREAADIPATDAPARITRIAVKVEPGRRFRFGKARMKPYAPGTELPPAYRDAGIAYSTAIIDAAEAGVVGWRKRGYAKASVADQTIIADHDTGQINAEILLDAGPKLRFGDIQMTGNQRMKARRILKIAGYHSGDQFNPDTLDEMTRRLRRTGIFRSVNVTEAKTANPDGSLTIGLNVIEQPPRRFGVAAEASRADGLDLSAFWLHRNLFGGGERLRVDGAVNRVDLNSKFDEYEYGVRIDRPATPVTDSNAYVEARAKREKILGQDLRTHKFEFGLTRDMSKALTLTAGAGYLKSSIVNVNPHLTYRVLDLPLTAELDRRDDILNPRKGTYLLAGATPFYGLGSTDSGIRMTADARGYRTFGTNNTLTLAARLQLNTVAGSQILGTPPDFLFYSGGGGTVRGHPYRSLGVTITRPNGSPVQIGGRSFLGVSGEARLTINDRVGAVAFYDAGYVSAKDFWRSGGEWQTGIGVGMRYDTGLGPIRLDLGFPVTGKTRDGMQVYIGIGQAF